jgi:quercetin dioxygenase-like cupin family protein
MVRTDEQCESTPPDEASLLSEDAFQADSVAIDEVQERTKAGGSEPDAAVTRVLDLAAVAGAYTGRGPAATLRSNDLDVNLLVFGAGQGVAEHENGEIDVLVVGIVGEGVVTIDGRTHPLRAGQTVLIPKGTRRVTQATTDRFSYLTCHRRRGELRPAIRSPK